MEMYKFIKQIDQGRYGDVWLVKGSKTKRKYVLKRIDFNGISKREQRAAHLETKLLCTLKHPNIITYVDSFYDSAGSLFIIMNNIEHDSLHDFIKDQNGVYLEEEEIVNLFVQICMAIKYLHDQSILHRDIKTQNIFLTKQKLIKIGDFGITRLFSISENQCFSLISSPCYTSPEVLAGTHFDQKSDVWSVGCCAYEIAALKYAFITQDISTSLNQVIKSKLSTISKVYSSQLSQLIASMLDLEPEKRPSITELLLNDYIRKHILLCLKNPSERNSSFQNCSCKIRNIGSRKKSDSSSSISINEINVCKNRIKKTIFKTIPDVNGNGDGNDNSQQGAPYDETSQDIKKNSTVGSDKLNDSCDKNATEIKAVLSTKNADDVPDIKNSQSKNQLEKRLTFNSLKMRSDISFQFLSSLASSINISRFKSSDSFNDSDLLFKTRYSDGENPPKSADELSSFSKKKYEYTLSRPATSAELNFSCITSDFKKPHLPQINENVVHVKSTMDDYNLINLPSVPSTQSLCEKYKDVSKNYSLPKLEETLVDKILLCSDNTIKQKNSIASDFSSYLQHQSKLKEVLPPRILHSRETMYKASTIESS